MQILKSTVLSVFFFSWISAQPIVNKIDPPNWWTNMNYNKIELMIYGENLKNIRVEFENNKIEVKNITETESGNYLFVELDLSQVKFASDYKFSLIQNQNSAEAIFPILKREFTKDSHAGFSPKDVIYLITPDRFANGDELNDKSPKGLPNQFDRKNRLARHGGDIQGIINQLDYLKDLGITAIWINPLVENNHGISYHGYAATDFYNVDARFGNNELYKKLVNEAHKKGLKIIYDHVSNHTSNLHPWIANLPFNDWIHGSIENHQPANHEKMVYFDPNSSENTIEKVETGWFVSEMPDLNQSNPHVAKYIIQNTLWWIEFAGIDGVREDTYPYVNPEFLSNWANVILNEYPNINIVGEVWSGEPSYLAGYQSKSKVRNFETNLPTVTDFGIRDAFYFFLTNQKDLHYFYQVISKDFLFSNPNNLVTFIDNHDVERPMLLADENLEKVKLAYSLLFTIRGIPQFLYGDEIGLIGGTDHGDLRQDFPGGWKEDSRNAFTKKGRTEEENEMFNHIQKLIKLRKENEELSIGRTEHFPTQNNLYFFYRILDDEKTLIVVNGSDEYKIFNLLRFDENLKNKNIIDIYTNEKINSEKIKLKQYDFKILKIK